MDFPKLSMISLEQYKVLLLTVQFAVGLGSGFCWTKATDYPLSVTTSPPHTLCRSMDSMFVDTNLYKQNWCNSALLRVLYLIFKS